MNQSRSLTRTAGFLALLAIPVIATGCHRQFEKADTNKNGKLEVGELDTALAKALYEAGDKDKNQNLTYQEWHSVYPKSKEATFNKYDTDGTPGLSLAEATAGLQDEGVFAKLSAKVDTNHDGVIDKSEASVFHDAMEAADGSNQVQKLDSLINS